jgi:hypothetical protein
MLLIVTIFSINFAIANTGVDSLREDLTEGNYYVMLTIYATVMGLNNHTYMIMVARSLATWLPIEC